ncbi:MAG: ABC transporter substrate-binding protein [Deinococcota bacterium]
MKLMITKLMTTFAALVALMCVTSALALDCSAGLRAFSHVGGETCIPEKAERIVSLHDQSFTLSLLELGAPVVGSMGRIDDDGNFYMRAVDLMLGLDFENSGITYVGAWDETDYEMIASLEPDLIIGWDGDAQYSDKHEAIAPAVYIAASTTDPLAVARSTADAAGLLPEWEAQLAIYRANIDRAKYAFPQAEGASYSKIQGWDGNLEVYAGFGGLTMVLEDLGFVRTSFGQDMADRGIAWGETVSAEVLPELQADYLFDTYTIAYGDTLADPYERLNEVFPNWCDFLTACGEGRYIVLPREYSTGYSFTQLNTLIHLISTHAARNPAPRG